MKEFFSFTGRASRSGLAVRVDLIALFELEFIRQFHRMGEAVCARSPCRSFSKHVDGVNVCIGFFSTEIVVCKSGLSRQDRKSVV